tara:strand:+ start:9975 stop:11114 length:1140 start_codon:yes stop_codon:yes gene_type:complete
MNSLLFYIFKLSTKILLYFVFFSTLLFNNYEVFAQNKDFVVVLDAGHGGKDPGKVGFKKVKEKEIALKIVLLVGNLLEKQKNIKVIYTRKTDVFVDLWERGRIANKADADLFVSVHCNSWHTNQPNGTETYVLGLHANERNLAVAKAENEVILLEDNYQEKYKGFNLNSPESFIGLTLLQEEYLDQSIQLASIVQNNIIKDIKRKDRGVKQAGFVVLHQTYMPSILIESGFLTNSSDFVQLSESKGQLKIATAIFNGVSTYINQLAVNTVNGNENLSVEKPDILAKNKDFEAIENVFFKVQIASGSRKLETKAYNFKGLENIDRIKIGNSYKYYLGNTTSYREIKELHKKAKSKGYTTAFIVAFKNGVKISVEEVLKKS